MNPTVRKYARSMEEAFPVNTLAIQRLKTSEWFEGPQSRGRLNAEVEFWLVIALAFGAGVLARSLWG